MKIFSSPLFRKKIHKIKCHRCGLSFLFILKVFSHFTYHWTWIKQMTTHRNHIFQSHAFSIVELYASLHAIWPSFGTISRIFRWMKGKEFALRNSSFFIEKHFYLCVLQEIWAVNSQRSCEEWLLVIINYLLMVGSVQSELGSGVLIKFIKLTEQYLHLYPNQVLRQE